MSPDTTTVQGRQSGDFGATSATSATITQDAGEDAAGLAAMRRLLDAESSEAARAAVTGDPTLGASEREALLALMTPAAYVAVRGVAASVDHAASGGSVEARLAQTAAGFDRAAALSPEGSVALYSLGDPVRLAAATAEVCGWLRAQGLLGPDRRMLEIGCGIGRFPVALADEVELIVGLDLSAGMVAEAGRRCAALPNALPARTGGRDLACVADRSVDLVLFADSFPYLIQAGGGLPERHLSEAARVLRPGGAVAVLNWSYRGDLTADAVEAQALARVLGLNLASPTRPFSLWDGTAFVFEAAKRTTVPAQP